MIAARSHLEGVPLFAELSDAELDLVLEASRLAAYPKENIVFNEGDPGDAFFVLIAGRVKLTLLGSEGQETILAILEPPSFFGELALLDGAPRSATAVTLSKSTFLRVSRERFGGLLLDHPALATKLATHLARCLRDANDQIRSLSMFDAYGRILRCLLKLAARHGAREGKRLVLKPRPPHHELAHMIGCSRETVSRAMTVLQETGFVHVIDGGLVLEERAVAKYMKGAHLA